jgi:hypothetical protein
LFETTSCFHHQLSTAQAELDLESAMLLSLELLHVWNLDLIHEFLVNSLDYEVDSLLLKLRSNVLNGHEDIAAYLFQRTVTTV